MEEEIHHRRYDYQCQEEAENGPTAAALGSDWCIGDNIARIVEAPCFFTTQSHVFYIDVTALSRLDLRETLRARLGVRV